jgi:hypothetical protein
MKLDGIDTRSACWIKLSAHLEARLTTLRARNDGALTPDETVHLRGRIAQIKEILALAQAEPGDEVVTDDATAMGGQFLTYS